MVLVAVPFWSDAFMRSSAGFSWGKWLIGASPFLAAAMPWVGAGGSWCFDPRTSAVLYDMWVGTDIPLVYPSWVSCALGHLLAAGLLLACGELPPMLRRRIGPRGSSGRAGEANRPAA